MILIAVYMLVSRAVLYSITYYSGRVVYLRSRRNFSTIWFLFYFSEFLSFLKYLGIVISISAGLTRI